MWMLAWALGIADAQPLEQLFVEADQLLQQVGVQRDERRELASAARLAIGNLASPADVQAVRDRVVTALSAEQVDVALLHAVRRDVVRRIDDGSAELLDAVVPMLQERTPEERLALFAGVESAIVAQLRAM